MAEQSATPAQLREMTERELEAAKVPWPETLDELNAIIVALTERSHDYGTCVYAMSMAATAAYNFVAKKLGTTGFQASCADLDIVRRTRCIDGPFALITAERMLYPQYSIPNDVTKFVAKWKPWAGEQARKKLAEGGGAHPDVRAHWEELAKQPAPEKS